MKWAAGKKKNLLQYSYCIAGNSKLGIVLQEAWLQKDCIAIQKNCIVTRQGTWAGLYCNTATALAIQHGLGAAGAGGVRAGSRWVLGGLGARHWADWALGAGARDRRAAAGAGARGAGQQVRQGRAAAEAAGVRRACGLGVGREAFAHLGVPAGCSCTRLGF